MNEDKKIKEKELSHLKIVDATRYRIDKDFPIEIKIANKEGKEHNYILRKGG